MEPSLMVVGLNYRTAPMAVREQFWISESRRSEVLQQLSSAEGIDEVIVLATCNRTEFWLWAADATLAANSVMRMLGSDFGLKLCEWKHFYRLLDEGALHHIFCVASSLDSMVVGESQVVTQVEEAWRQAEKAGATGRFLDTVVTKALAVSERVRNETAVGEAAVSIPRAAVGLVQEVLGALENKSVVLLGTCSMNELAGRGLVEQARDSIRLTVVDRNLTQAAALAEKLGGTGTSFDERWKAMSKADVIMTSSCPPINLTRDEIEGLVRERERQPLVLVDLAMPRHIDPSARDLKGVHLFDLDELETVSDERAHERELAIAAAEKILHAEAQGFRHKLTAERNVTTIAALRLRLDEICRQELECFRQENGPFSKDQDEMLSAVMSRITQKIAGSLARELKELPEKVQQEQMASALQRLFHLQPAKQALAGTKLA